MSGARSGLVTDLVEFVAWLREQIDEDERVALAAAWSSRRVGDNRPTWQRSGINSVEDAGGGLVVHGDGTPPSDSQADHIARHDPARVLAEVAAKRAILDLHEPYESERVGGQSCWACNRDGWPCETVRLLAQPFAGRPGWREEWATGGAA
jgi:hypothetical protein